MGKRRGPLGASVGYQVNPYTINKLLKGILLEPLDRGSAKKSVPYEMY